MADPLVELSHSINNQSAAQLVNGPDLTEPERRPRGRPPKEETPKKEKDTEQFVKKVKELSKLDKVSRIKKYLAVPFFRKKLGPVLETIEHLKKGLDGATEDEINTIWSDLQFHLNFQGKMEMVNHCFSMFCKGGEDFAVQFLHMQRYQHISKRIMQNKEFFDPELYEIAIEMGDYDLGPKWRLAFKLAQFVMAYNYLEEQQVRQQQQGSSSSSSQDSMSRMFDKMSVGSKQEAEEDDEAGGF